MRNITFKITTDNQKPSKNGTFHLKLRIKTPKKYILRSGVHVKSEHWDDKHGDIKKDYLKLYPEESKTIREIYDRVGEIRQPLQKQEMSVNTAFDILLGKHKQSGSILEYAERFEPDAKTSQSTIDKHIANISAIQTGLTNNGYKKYIPLEFSHLQDDTCIGNIATVITTKLNLKTNTQASYMKTLNWVCMKSKQKLRNPFTHHDYMVTEKPSGKNKPVANQDLQIGFNNINTMHQFEALCFWLYSFCLMGLDGVDIVGLSENDIVTDGYKKDDLRDYIPESDILGNEDYFKPIHVHTKRSKTQRGATDSGVDAIFQVNLFPTLIVLELLKHSIKHNIRGYGYKGNDALRLYNFDVKTTKGYKEWIKCRNTYTSQMNAKVGTTTQQARHTVTSIAQKIGLSDKQIDALLNHKDGTVLANYTDKEELQIEKDVSQIHVFQHFRIIEVISNLIQFFKGKKEVIGNEEVPFIPDSVMYQVVQKRRVKRLHRHQMFEIGKLTNFSRDDEMRYQTLIKDVQKGRVVFKDGRMVTELLDEIDYPKELTELIEKRKNIYNSEVNFKQSIMNKIEFIDEDFDEDFDEENFKKYNGKGKVISIGKKTGT
ncbi:hypothetical protein OAT68_01430 [Flavobacteriaceae bacterium]|nr:hypothetical protein [Flavobacteriaceae bacterium]